MFDSGDKVNTKFGFGTVISRRMASPTYSTVAAYSVSLDDKRRESEQPPFRSYSGTVIPAEDVYPIE
jgi:hypothetical protein